MSGARLVMAKKSRKNKIMQWVLWVFGALFFVLMLAQRLGLLNP